MTELGTQIDSDKRLLLFATYKDYLDSLVTFVDLGYLGNLNVARQLAKLGYRCTGETLDKETFYRRLKAVRDLLFPIYKPYVLTSEHVEPKDMRNLWKGEVTSKFKEEWPQEQGDYALGTRFTRIIDDDEGVSNLLRSKSFELLQDDTFRNESLLQTLYLDDITDEAASTGSESCQTHSENQMVDMASIVGTYQHESNENLDEYFKAVGVPYIPRKMMSMSSPRLEISNDGDKWTICTISMFRTAQLTFTLNEEYEEHMPAGVTLKNVTTMEEDGLVTVSVGPDNNKVVRKYEVTKDGVVLIMTHEKSGQVAKRYFKRLS
ncbi:uncharacterized protein LOC108626820 [Ceratina calcarata]|uniref:Uncharacterized protein LOC108626820 n=1 Tax=Ceratina calcarata TaxID=156304 RepID=A0AAJ7S4U6_9HYME|nr:uncharacterized protein LOC108626820 [Ceratina calcarata]